MSLYFVYIFLALINCENSDSSCFHHSSALLYPFAYLSKAFLLGILPTRFIQSFLIFFGFPSRHCVLYLFNTGTFLQCCGSGSGRIWNYLLDPDSGSVIINSGSDKLQFLVTKLALNLLSPHWLLTILLQGQKNSQVPVDFKNFFFKIKIYVAVLFKNFGFVSLLRN